MCHCSLCTDEKKGDQCIMQHNKTKNQLTRVTVVSPLIHSSGSHFFFLYSAACIELLGTTRLVVPVGACIEYLRLSTGERREEWSERAFGRHPTFASYPLDFGQCAITSIHTRSLKMYIEILPVHITVNRLP